MKRILFITTLMFGTLICAPCSVYAQDEAPEIEAAEEEAVAVEQPVTIPDMLAKVKYLTKVKPKKKAAVYFILRSHSKCGPCRAAVPQLVPIYKEMRGKGAELIMLSGDGDVEAAEKWAEEAGMNYPIVTNETIGAVNIPAGGTGGTPNVMAVMSDGTIIEGTSGYKKVPVLVGNWKEFVKQAKKDMKAKAKAKEKVKKAKKAKKKAAPVEAEDADSNLAL